jgi:hypothetical protein
LKDLYGPVAEPKGAVLLLRANTLVFLPQTRLDLTKVAHENKIVAHSPPMRIAADQKLGSSGRADDRNGGVPAIISCRCVQMMLMKKNKVLFRYTVYFC